MATDLCLRVLKFSHALGVRADNTIPWIHLQASDIFAVVRGKDTQIADGQLSLDVVQGTTVLESLSVAQYIDAARQARRGAESHGVRLETEQLPIFGITKDALLALRYRHEPDGKQRRIQLRFEDVTQCRELVTAFVRRGMEFQEQHPATARMNQARPSTGQGPERLLTATSSSPYFDAEQASGCLNTTHSQSAPQHDRWSETASQPQNGHIPNFPIVKHSQDIASQDMGPPRYFSRDEVAAPREAVPERPSTAQIYRSFTTPSQQTLIEPQEILRRPSDAAGERPSSTSHISHLAAIREAVEEAASPPATAPNMPRMDMATSMANVDWSSGIPEPATLNSVRSETVGALSSSARPSTAATTLPPEHYELPPPRILPFKRPSSKSSSTGSKTAKSTKPAMVMSRLPASTAVDRAARTPELTAPPPFQKKAGSSRPATSSPLKRSLNAISDDSIAHTSSPTKKPRTSHATTPSDQILRKPSGMQQLLNNHKSLSSSNPTTTTLPRLNSLADAPHEIDENPPHPSPKVRTAQTIPLNAPATATEHDNPETSLEEYATQSLPDRQAALEDFMMRNLENPAFTKLCEDVENCWRRIALGL
ncbi:hypothetical protein LTR86_000322 [Recurvomyces mirabilis]|nr:hypothetical protein LTR86_000322 [Recurvomyces mirabilis]